MLCSSFNAFSLENTYFGANINTCKTCFKKSYGDEIFKNRSVGGEVFWGVPLNENIAIEFGYQSLTNRKYSVVTSGKRVNGLAIPAPIKSIVYKTQVQIRGPYAGIMLFADKQKFNGLQPFFGFGLMDINTKLRRQALQINQYAYFSDREMKKTKIVHRSTVGFNYFLSDKYMLRSSITYINTGRIQGKSSDKYPVIRSNLKNTICFGLGFSLQND